MDLMEKLEEKQFSKNYGEAKELALRLMEAAGDASAKDFEKAVEYIENWIRMTKESSIVTMQEVKSYRCSSVEELFEE